MNPKVKCAFIIPSYNETLALPLLLSELHNSLTDQDAILIMDDSPYLAAEEIEKKCHSILKDGIASFYFYNHQGKSGRGAAIRRGMNIALDLFPNLEFVIECDADGSHRPVDILKIRDSNPNVDLLIGSRYLTQSDIVGWPASRKIFSSLLNLVIPRVLGIDVKDITNGLRRYSISAVKLILNFEQKNAGFIYLSEQALIIKDHNLYVCEIPTTFLNRTLGASTVTWREVFKSFKGISRLIFNDRNRLA